MMMMYSQGPMMAPMMGPQSAPEAAMAPAVMAQDGPNMMGMSAMAPGVLASQVHTHCHTKLPHICVDLHVEALLQAEQHPAARRSTSYKLLSS